MTDVLDGTKKRGLAISTATKGNAYVNLQLAALRPTIKSSMYQLSHVLIVADLDADSEEFKELEGMVKHWDELYGELSGQELENYPSVELVRVNLPDAITKSNKRSDATGGITIRHCIGDMQCLALAFQYMKKNGVELMVKFSRRFIPCYDWFDTIVRIHETTHHATYGSWDSHSRFGFRTECAAYDVDAWTNSGCVQRILNQGTPVLVEHFIWELAGVAWKYKKATNEISKYTDRTWENPNGHCFSRNYAEWFISGVARDKKTPDVLWHMTDSPADYQKMFSELYSNNQDLTIISSDEFVELMLKLDFGGIPNSI